MHISAFPLQQPLPTSTHQLHNRNNQRRSQNAPPHDTDKRNKMRTRKISKIPRLQTNLDLESFHKWEEVPDRVHKGAQVEGVREGHREVCVELEDTEGSV